MLAENTLELQSAEPLYALNLFSASTPNALPRPSAQELERFTFFTTQTKESGRIRFHLHMGFFDSKEQASAQLSLVRATYPWAWVSLMPTDLTEGTGRLLSVIGQVHPLFSRANGKKNAPPVNAQSSLNKEDEGTSAVESQNSPEPAEPPRVRKLHASKILAVKKGEGSIVAIETCKYAVQLLWSVMPVSIERARNLDLFDEYILYVAQCEFEGRKWYALRLGFFSRAQSALTIAKYLRSEFCSAALIPVTKDEKLQVRRISDEAANNTLNTQTVSLMLSDS